ncbi:MAG: low molecular weight protein-tyrosine-phosphatase [Rhodanobacter sp.]
MFKQVLVVCLGNICRSPTAEFLLRERLQQSDSHPYGVQVASAGLTAMVGRPMEATAAQVLREHGVDGGSHRARQLTPTMLRDSDVVLVMERAHVAEVRRVAPEFGGKVFLLGKWQANASIPDPYGQRREAFDRAYRLIERGVTGWLPHLQAS